MERPDIIATAPDPVYAGRYAVRCNCGRVFDAWVDSLPYIQCPGCKIVVESKTIRDWKKEERWAK